MSETVVDELPSFLRKQRENPTVLHTRTVMKGNNTPESLTGTIYKPEDFTTNEYLARLKEKIPAKNIPRNKKELFNSVLFELREELPKDIILATNEWIDLDYLVYEKEPRTALKAYVCPGGFLSHGALILREQLKNVDLPDGFAVLGSIRTRLLESGNSVEIDLSKHGEATLKVTPKEAKTPELVKV